jgi:hypothetical protein
VLAKHYSEAIGFDIVFFLPDSEDDFASYTEFLHYLGSKNRAGVAKFDDGTTLFLVPPSDFLKNVLKVAGPERLYGVVLKLPQQAPNNKSMQQQLPQPIHFSQYTNNQISPPEADYNLLHQQEEQVMSIHHNRVLHEDSKLPSKPIYPLTTVSHAVLPVPQEYASNHSAAPSSAGFLTPDLIATLSTLLPANKQSSSESNQPELGSPIVRPPFSSVIPDKGTSSQGWKHDNQVSGNTSHLQFGNHLNYQLQVQSQFQPSPSVPSTYSHSTNVVPRNSQIQDSTVSLSHQSATPSRPLTSFSMPSQSGQFALSPQVSQQNLFEVPHSTQKGYGVVHGTYVMEPTVHQLFRNLMILIPCFVRFRAQIFPRPNLGSHHLQTEGMGSFPVKCSNSNLLFLYLGGVSQRLIRIRDTSQRCSLQPTSCSSYSSSRIPATLMHMDLGISNEFSLKVIISAMTC